MKASYYNIYDLNGIEHNNNMKFTATRLLVSIARIEVHWANDCLNQTSFRSKIQTQGIEYIPSSINTLFQLQNNSTNILDENDSIANSRCI